MKSGVAVDRRHKSVHCGTFDVLSQGLPCAGVLDAVSTPGGEELDQPSRGRVRDGGLKAVAVQDHQRVLFRVQAGSGSHAARDEPQYDQNFKPEPEHPCRLAVETHTKARLSHSGRTSKQLLSSKLRVFTAESRKTDRHLTLSRLPETRGTTHHICVFKR